MVRSTSELHELTLFVLAGAEVCTLEEVRSRIAINIDDVNNVVLDKDNWREEGRKKTLLLLSVTATAALNIT